MRRIADIFRRVFPAGLWTRRFAVAAAGAFATVLWFDIDWSMATSFRGMSSVCAYLYAGALALLLALPAAFCRPRWPMALLLALFDCLCVANLMYVRTYFMPIPPASYLLVSNVAEFGESIRHSLRAADALFIVITAVTVWLMGRGPLPPGRRAYWPTLGAFVALCIVVPLHRGGTFAFFEHLKGECYYRSTTPVVFTLPVSILADALESNRPVGEPEKAAARRWLAESDSLRRTMLADTVSRRYIPRNLVLIIVESLEAWPVGARVEGREITPRLNALLADSATTWMARRVLSQVGPGRSADGQLLMTVGLHPTTDYVYSMRFPDHTYPHLRRALAAHRGAKSYFLIGDRPTTWNQAPMMRQYGFDVTRFRDDWDCSEWLGHKGMPSDGSFLRQAAAKMERGELWPVGETAFVETVTYSSHFPFQIPASFVTLDLKADYPDRLDDYIEVIGYVDRSLGDYIDYLRGRPDADSTMIVVVGDHEALASMRDGMRRHSAAIAALVDAEPYVPMIVINSPVAGRRADVMGQVDVYSTVLDLMGLWGEPDVFSGMGYSALRPRAPRWAVDNAGYVAGDTVGADPALLRSVLAAPRASSAIIRADMLRGQ